MLPNSFMFFWHSHCTQHWRWVPLFVGLLSSISSPNLYVQPGIPHHTCKTWQLLLLNFTPLVIGQVSNLSKSLCKTSLPFRESSVPPNLVSSANLLSMHISPASRSVTKRTGPKMAIWGRSTLYFMHCIEKIWRNAKPLHCTAEVCFWEDSERACVKRSS